MALLIPDAMATSYKHCIRWRKRPVSINCVIPFDYRKLSLSECLNVHKYPNTLCTLLKEHPYTSSLNLLVPILCSQVIDHSGNHQLLPMDECRSILLAISQSRQSRCTALWTFLVLRYFPSVLLSGHLMGVLMLKQTTSSFCQHMEEICM